MTTVQQLCCFCYEPICVRCGSVVDVGPKEYLCCPKCGEEQGVDEVEEAAKAAEAEKTQALAEDDKDHDGANEQPSKRRRALNSKDEAKPTSKSKAKLLKDLKDSAAAVNYKSKQ